MNDTYSMPFTVQELWLMQSVIRHEMADMEKWKFPPVSMPLNREIGEALLTCKLYKLPEYHLELSLGDCLVIDHQVPSAAKDASGTMIGQEILLKAWCARRMIEGDTEAIDEPPVNIENFKKAKAKLEAERASTDTDDNPDH